MLLIKKTLFLKKNIMIIEANIAKAIYDFEWVLRVLESSTDGIHMDCTLKCFYLWEKKHSNLKEINIIFHNSMCWGTSNYKNVLVFLQDFQILFRIV